MQDDKYIVFKRKDIEAWMQDLKQRPTYHGPPPPPVSDAVVLRHQDVLCAPMLGLYRDMLTMLLKVQQDQRVIDAKALQRVADWFDQNAAEAADTGWKLPD